MKILVVGDGRMGRAVCEKAREKKIEVVGVVSADGNFEGDGYEKVDCVVDFSHDELTQKAVDFCIKNSLPMVTGTTALSSKTKNGLARLALTSSVCASENFSVGVAAMRAALKSVLVNLSDFDIEIVEKHHRNKADAPSGTAKMLMRRVAAARKNVEFVCGRQSGKRTKNQVGVAILRGGSVVGEHRVEFLGDGESLIITHTAWERGIFADGAIKAAEKLVGKIGFFRYEELLFEVKNG